MSATSTIQRQTKYCQSIEQTLGILGHATNAEILIALRKLYPDLSATTIHRATARLAERGIIAVAPSDNSGSMQYDSNIKPHDHFQCAVCGRLYDINIKNQITPIIEAAINGCEISGRLFVTGACRKCIKK